MVVPTSVLRTWANHIAQFRPNLRVRIYHGIERELGGEADVVLTTYGLLRRDIDRLAAEQWETVILDESQMIKNPLSQVAQAAYRLSSRWKLALSGTPIENRLEDLWSLFHFLNPGMLGPRNVFDDRYTRAIERGDQEARQQLARRTKPLILRRKKEEVATDLPPRTETVVYCQLDAEERDIYNALLHQGQRELVSEGEQGKEVSTMQILEILLRLRQAACHRALLPGQIASQSSKVDLLIENLEEILAEGHKALVYSQWTRMLDLVEKEFTARKMAFVRLDGATRDRQRVVDTFQATDGPPLMLLSLKAGGVGITLTAADHVFLLDPWWNPAAEAQAADRAHRIGQDKPVMICRLISEETVEEGILALQQHKRALADLTLEGAGASGAVTRDELMGLIEQPTGAGR